MNEERDKFLTEQMGECWHEFDVNSSERSENWDGFSTRYSGHWNVCIKCGEECIEEVANDHGFDSWDGFGELVTWTMEQPWFDELLYHYWSCPSDRKVFPYHFIHPARFADALYKFLSGVFPSFYLKWKKRYENTKIG